MMIFYSKKNTMENMNKFIIKNPKIIGYGLTSSEKKNMD